jgi:hypothetical protein
VAAYAGKLSGRGQDLSLLTEMVDEHSRLDPLLHEIDDTLHQASPARSTGLFAELADVLVDHFEHEEKAALPLVQQTLSANEWKAFGDDQRRRIGLRGAGWFSPWLLDDAAPDPSPMCHQHLCIPRPLLPGYLFTGTELQPLP